MPKLQNLKFKEFEKFLFAEGCVFVRSKGDHFIYQKYDLDRPIVLPKYKTIPEFIISNNLRLLNKTKKDLLDFLSE